MPALFIVLGIAVVVFIAAAGHQKHPAHHDRPAPVGVVVELDRGMPPSVVAQVLTALGEESDPSRLDALATSLAAYYPLAASELHAKAMTLRGGTVAVAPAALPPAATLPALPAADVTPKQAPPATRQLDAAAVLQAAMRALVEETDPVVLEGFAESIRAPYPAAAEILSKRAQTLRGSTQAPAEGAPPASSEPLQSDTAALTLSPEVQS